ncbi:polyubiquitin-C [Ceratobasidium sp. AG-Ba]|nr:polyubiquitin-C [Ceratobasidium sp. AG-Ba]
MSNTVTKRFIAAEYNGRQVAVRRCADYEITLTLIKEAFKPLKFVDVERISISAFVEEIGDSLEISKNIWSDLLPELKRVTITLDSSSTETDDSDYPSSDVNEESSEGGDEGSNQDDIEIDITELEDLENDCLSEDQTPQPTPKEPSQPQAPSCELEFYPTNHRRIVKPRAYHGSYHGQPVPLPPSLPPQNNTDVDQRYLKAFYFHKQRTNWTSAEIVTAPTTTIVDLQEYIALLSLFKGFIVSYQLFGETFDDLTYVSEMEPKLGPKKVQVQMDDLDPGPCNMGQNGGVCQVCLGSVGSVPS